MMNKQFTEVKKTDLMSLDEYSKNRASIRKDLVNYKKK